MKDVIVSIETEYATKILSGEKTVKFCENICPQSINKIIIYELPPGGLITGEVRVEAIVSGDPRELWYKFGNKANISKQDYDRKFLHKNRISAYCLSNPRRYKNTIKLSEFGLSQAPRSMIYL